MVNETSSAQLQGYVTASYRYLRLSIIAVLLCLSVSVLIEHGRTHCWQGSISAYYYTPVHSFFIGALVALAVGLIALKGATEWEDVLFNVAGVLAAIVAFVPTSPPGADCASAGFTTSSPSAFIDNNLLALAIGGGVLILAIGVWALANREDAREMLRPGPSLMGIVLGSGLFLAGLGWYVFFHDSFIDHAHGGGAVVLFLLIGVVVALNAIGTPRPGFRVGYIVVAAAMVLSVVAVMVGRAVRQGWRHQVLWLEILELGALAAFWVLQTWEYWPIGVPTGVLRHQRSAQVAGRWAGRGRAAPPDGRGE